MSHTNTGCSEGIEPSPPDSQPGRPTMSIEHHTREAACFTVGHHTRHLQRFELPSCVPLVDERGRSAHLKNKPGAWRYETYLRIISSLFGTHTKGSRAGARVPLNPVVLSNQLNKKLLGQRQLAANRKNCLALIWIGPLAGFFFTVFSRGYS
jgi:hypothetical protein